MRAAVLGKPIAHSLSPVLHRAAYQALGLADWTYDLVECDEAGLAGYVDSRGPDWAGLSLTMPLKRTVLPLLDHVDQVAAATGGANTRGVPPRGPLRLQHRRPGHRGRAHRGGLPVTGRCWTGSGHHPRRGRDGLLGARRRRRARRARCRRGAPRPGPRRRPARHRRPARPAGAAAPLGGSHQRRCGGIGPADLDRPRRCRGRLRRTGAADSAGARRRPRRGVPPVADPARAGGRGHGLGRGERLRDAAAPGRRPGGADDRQARPGRGDARGRRGS